MVDLLHAEAIQQLKVALLGSPAAHIIDLLMTGSSQFQPTSISTAVHHPQAYTSTPSAPPLTSIPVVAVTSAAPGKATDESAATASDPQEVPQSVSKHCNIVPTLIPSSEVPYTSSTSSPSYPIINLSFKFSGLLISSSNKAEEGTQLALKTFPRNNFF